MRQPTLPSWLAVYVLCLCLAGVYDTVSAAEAVPDAAGLEYSPFAQFGWKDAQHGRSLLQNPDRPALTKYGGVTMQRK